MQVKHAITLMTAITLSKLNSMPIFNTYRAFKA